MKNKFTVKELKEELEQVPDEAEIVRIDFLIVDDEEEYTIEYYRNLTSVVLEGETE